MVSGTTIAADVVVMGTGVAPATDFLKKSGLKLEEDGGIEVDGYLRVKGKENVYAIGDIAHFPQVNGGELIRIEHWNVAGNHGRAVGKTVSFDSLNCTSNILTYSQIAGDPQPYVKVPVFWSARECSSSDSTEVSFQLCSLCNFRGSAASLCGLW